MTSQPELHNRLVGEIADGKAVIRLLDGSAFTTFGGWQARNIEQRLAEIQIKDIETKGRA
jgi:hypothetical protein